MARFKLFLSLLVVVGVCTLAATSAKPAPKPKCGFNGDYSFFFFSPNAAVTGVGYFTVALRAPKCRSGVVVPGGIIDCNVDGIEYEDFIESGYVFVESDGEGTMVMETNSTRGVCGTGRHALELDISVALGGRKVRFNSNAVSLVRSGTIPNAGNSYVVTGSAGKCFSGDLSGCYDIEFFEPTQALAGDCTVCLAGGLVTGGSCRCNSDFVEYFSSIVSGGYNLGGGCQSNTGLLRFITSSDKVCGQAGTVYLNFAVANGGKDLMGACGSANPFDCAFEGNKQ